MDPHFDIDSLNKTISGIKLSDVKAERVLCNFTHDDWRIEKGKDYKIHYRETGPYIFVGSIFSRENIDLADMSQCVLNDLELINLD